MSKAKKDILVRINIVYFALCLVGLTIVAQVVKIQLIEGANYRSIGANTTRVDTLVGKRGNIYSEKGRLLATSLPVFQVRVDMRIQHDTILQQELDTLAACLANYFQDKEKEEYLNIMLKGREQRNGYVLLKDNVQYGDLPYIKQLPVFKYGRFRGGLILEAENDRVKPFNILARRTIGYDRENTQPVGIEGSFDKYLRGSLAPRSMIRLAGGAWVPLFDEYDIEVKNGKDVYTSINVDMQDIAENALKNALYRFKAEKGCAIVMEVATGKIKAIANLGANGKGQYIEDYNYAVGEKSDPGSTFKVASLAALLEDGFVNDSTLVDIEGGRKQYHDRIMQDASWYPYDTITVRKMMEISSNVGISKLIDIYYGVEPEKFIKHLTNMRLTEPTGIEINGEPSPVVKNPESSNWSGITLTQMSIGYEIELTPLQMLTFFNAIANNGTMMKPYLVTDVKEYNKTIKHFKPQVLDKRICSEQTAETIKDILQGIVEKGTAKNIYNPNLSMACKTGTAKIAIDDKGYKAKYQGSVAGFFPADNPIYSCIAVIYGPSTGEYYGGTVAAPVFKEIASHLYAMSIDKHQAVNSETGLIAGYLPKANHGHQNDLKVLYAGLGVDAKTKAETDWVVPKTKGNTVDLQQLRIIDNLIPNVTGMGLRDALYILENKGLKVKFSGSGKVTFQSPRYGTSCKRGDIVVLELH